MSSAIRSDTTNPDRHGHGKAEASLDLIDGCHGCLADTGLTRTHRPTNLEEISSQLAVRLQQTPTASLPVEVTAHSKSKSTPSEKPHVAKGVADEHGPVPNGLHHHHRGAADPRVTDQRRPIPEDGRVYVGWFPTGRPDADREAWVIAVSGTASQASWSTSFTSETPTELIVSFIGTLIATPSRPAA
ncbi:DUF317 domain-containing protein [Streptomyces phyllanthi]|uniref:DUF317 domain-containing protein n=1 Tax=Streptomyces phyllanthi TaxID=1803180 RepID=UPI003CD0BE1F